MLKAEEVASFLNKAERMSAEWTAQVQFMRDEFIPQMENLNTAISERSHVPDISRDVLNAFMLQSGAIGKYHPRNWLAEGNYAQGHRFMAAVHEKVDHRALIQMLFADDTLTKSFGTQHDFAFYFDAHYKDVLLGHKYANTSGTWSNHPVHIFTNYDFVMDISITNFTESSYEVMYGNRRDHVQRVVPLSGDNIQQKYFEMVTFRSLSSPATSVTNPNQAQLAAFLAKRKPYIHPVIVLDYVRTQPLSVVSAFFSDVAQYDLARAKDSLSLRGAEINGHAAENAALKKSLQAEAARVREMKEAHAAQEELLKQQRTKLNAAALRIKKLEIKLKQSEQMYEDLQMRLIDEEGLDDVDIGDLEFGDEKDEATVGTEPTRPLY